MSFEGADPLAAVAPLPSCASRAENPNLAWRAVVSRLIASHIRPVRVQEEIFMSLGRPITSACLQGYNSTVLAYGQTGSGKSHTMFGPDILMAGEVSALDCF